MKSPASVFATRGLVVWFLYAVAVQSMVLAIAYWLAPFNLLFFWKYEMSGFWADDSQLLYAAGPLVLEGIVLQLGSLVSVDMVAGTGGSLRWRLVLVGAFMAAGLAIFLALHVVFAYALTRPDMSWWRFSYRAWMPLTISVTDLLAARAIVAAGRMRRQSQSAEAGFEAEARGGLGDDAR